MKIRTGFVSNSSSSSFLVVYKSLKDFEKLDRFDGYNRLIKDLSESSPAEGLITIQNLLWHFVYDDFFRRVDFKLRGYYGDIWTLKTMTDIKLDQLDEMCDPIIEDFYNKIFNKYPDKKAIILFVEEHYRICLSTEENVFVNACRKEAQDRFWDKAFKKALGEKIEKISEAVLSTLQAKGYIVSSVKYEDHSQEGAMMEHGFLPFIANNPEREYEIFQVNEH